MSKGNHESHHSQLLAVFSHVTVGCECEDFELALGPEYVSRWRRSRAFIRACGALRKQEEVLKKGQQPNLARAYRLNYG